MKRVNPKEINDVGVKKSSIMGGLSPISPINPDVEVTVKNLTLVNGYPALYNDSTFTLNCSTFKGNETNRVEAIFNTVFNGTSEVYFGLVGNTASKVHDIYGDGHFSD